MTTTSALQERQPFLTDVEGICSRARHHLNQAGEGSKAHTDTVVQLLNEVLTMEMALTLRNLHKFRLAAQAYAPQIADELLDQAVEEQKHAELAAAQIAKLGGEPSLASNGLPPAYHLSQAEGMTSADMIRETLFAGEIVVNVCREIISYLGDREPASREMLEEILAAEEQQATALRRVLGAISTEMWQEQKRRRPAPAFKMDSVDETLDESFPASDSPSWFAGGK
jgi:bacterioferritin